MARSGRDDDAGSAPLDPRGRRFPRNQRAFRPEGVATLNGFQDMGTAESQAKCLAGDGPLSPGTSPAVLLF